MKRVFLCADGEKDMRTVFRHLISSGAAPAAPLMYALMLEPGSEEEYAQMTRAGESLLWLCDEVWVFGDTVTEGMRAELKFCKNLNIRVRKITEKEIQKAIGGNPL